jgi:O-methyltransferase involved in polyketide biosynthesis
MARRTPINSTTSITRPVRGVRQRRILAAGWMRAPTARLPDRHVSRDRPGHEVNAFKTPRRAELGARPPPSAERSAVDLREDWVSALAPAGFRPSAPPPDREGVCSAICRPEAQDRCWKLITENSAPAAVAAEAVPAPAIWTRRRPAERMQSVRHSGPTEGFDLDFSELVYSVTAPNRRRH